MKPSERIFFRYHKSICCEAEYEPVRFRLDENHGTFVPDFYCRKENRFYEVLRDQSAVGVKREKLINFRQCYPAFNCTAVRPDGVRWTETEIHGGYSGHTGRRKDQRDRAARWVRAHAKTSETALLEMSMATGIKLAVLMNIAKGETKRPHPKAVTGIIEYAREIETGDIQPTLPGIGI